MTNKEKHICEDCIHFDICEWGVSQKAFICDSFIDKKIIERPQGEWLYDGVYRDENNLIVGDMYHCSICKRSIIISLTKPVDLFPFCHCGADMRGML